MSEGRELHMFDPNVTVACRLVGNGFELEISAPWQGSPFSDPVVDELYRCGREDRVFSSPSVLDGLRLILKQSRVIAGDDGWTVQVHGEFAP